MITNWGLADERGQQAKKAVKELAYVVGILQHHDAMTGTEKQAVVKEYDTMLNKQIDVMEHSIKEIYADINRRNTIETQNESF